jgi:hypothetical protein
MEPAPIFVQQPRFEIAELRKICDLGGSDSGFFAVRRRSATPDIQN